MRFISFLIGSLLFFSITAIAQKKNTKKPYVVFVTGDHEYGSESTMPLIAEELEKNYGMRTRVLKSFPNHTSEENIPDLESLDSADLVVFYLRWRLLPAEQIAYIDKYLQKGKPLIGFRTTTHAFHYPDGDPQEKWNAFGEFAFGTPPGWGKSGHTHYGHESTTDVYQIPETAKNPILKGVDSSFHQASWLYQVLPDFPPKDATILLMGRAVNPDKKAEDNPVAWTWTTKQGAKSFFTTLGHPDDFKDPAFQRLVFNAICWGLNKPNNYWKGPIAVDVTYGIHPDEVE